MADAGYYRGEAERCRKLAAASPDSAAAKRWLQLASEYDDLAEALASAGSFLPRGPAQRQPMQQQQKKAQDDK